ncbi:rhomboid-domain-containing protein [Wilcoxina mikolae CBS 423.85]|nr:rhomboid-domain-containing protein [Wilcoxina mikolae CBS 423.85]
MAAADYYNTGHAADPPISPISHSPAPQGDANKPLPQPQQSSFPPTHVGGYNDDLSYAPHHYSQHSIDTGYHPHSYSNHSDDSPTKYGNTDPFSDNIPLHETGHKPHGQQLSAAEAGGAHLPPGGMRKHDLPRQRSRPWFVYIITIIQVAVFCGMLARNAQLQGTPIGIKPQFNPMIGPTTDVMINMGARFVPCMRVVESFKNTDPTQLYPCPNRTTLFLECSLAEWCGFNGRDIPSDLPGGTGPKGSTPNQWYRFIIPMFFHAGLVHLAFNMFIQVWMGGEIERSIGPIRFMIVYFCAGIFGFVLGGNLGSHGQPSVGASGSLFGIFALYLLEILYTWQERATPGKDLIFLLLDIALSFILGLLPAIDNFAHIGGFLAGIAIGLTVMRSPNQLRRKMGTLESDLSYTRASPTNPYNTSTGENNLVGFSGFVKQPLAFFKGRKPLWWGWWLVRAGMLAVIVIVFSVLLNNFYSPTMKACSWCKYLSCLPINGWCDMYDGLNVRNVTVNNPSRLLARGVVGLDEFW